MIPMEWIIPMALNQNEINKQRKDYQMSNYSTSQARKSPEIMDNFVPNNHIPPTRSPNIPINDEMNFRLLCKILGEQIDYARSNMHELSNIASNAVGYNSPPMDDSKNPTAINSCIQDLDEKIKTLRNINEMMSLAIRAINKF